MYVLFGILFIALFYFFILLPNAVKRYVKDTQQINDYNDELKHLRCCIEKANTVYNLNMCWHAVIEFHVRNKLKGLNVTKDANKLYTTIRHKIKTINN